MINKLQASLGVISVFALAMGSVGSISPAFAGEGGAAGAAVFHLNDYGKVQDSAVSGAVGKNNASATAFSITNDCKCKSTLSATAFGSAGTLETTITQDGYKADITSKGGVDLKPYANKENSLPSGSIVTEVGKGVVSF